MYSRAEYVLILEHYFASKSLVVLKAFNNVYSDKKYRVRQLPTEFRDTGSVSVTSANRATRRLEL